MSKILKYKKIIMLALILVAAIICVSAAYITEYNKTKIDVETLFTDIEEGRTFVDSEEFLKNYEYFHIFLKEGSSDAYLNSNDELVSGTQRFSVVSKNADSYSIRKDTVSIQAILAADWIGFISSSASTTKYTSGKDATLTISNIAQIFPAKGDLWFTGAKHPTLYVLVKWSEKDGQRYYTYLELEYKEYSVTPVIPEEPTEEPTAQ